MTGINVLLALILLVVVVMLVVSLLGPFLRRRHPTPEGEKPAPLYALVLTTIFGAIVGAAIVNFIANLDRRDYSAGIDGFDGPSSSDTSDSGSSGGDSGAGGGGDGG